MDYMKHGVSMCSSSYLTQLPIIINAVYCRWLLYWARSNSMRVAQFSTTPFWYLNWVQTKMKNTSARLSRLSELYLTLLGTEEALVLTTPVRHFQRLAFRVERRYKRYAIVLNVNSHSCGLCYQAKHLLANWWLKHYGLVEPRTPLTTPVTLAQYTMWCMLAYTRESNAATEVLHCHLLPKESHSCSLHSQMNRCAGDNDERCPIRLNY